MRASVLPHTTSPVYREVLDHAAGALDADLVIACRDPDVVVVAEANEDPTSPVVAPTAPAALIAMARDKFRTYQWCEGNSVPFVPSVAADSATAEDELADMVGEWGLPLIAKPRSGSGSLGVRVLTEKRHVKNVLGGPDMMVQPFVGPPSPQSLDLDLNKGIPLFFEVPVQDGTTAMAVIGRDGTVGPICTHDVGQRLGRNEWVARNDDSSFIAAAQHAALQFRDAGWRGPVCLCFRQARGTWWLFEVNARFSGGTPGRFVLGYNELRWTVNDWLGRDVIPRHDGPTGDRVVRYLTDYVDPRPL